MANDAKLTPMLSPVPDQTVEQALSRFAPADRNSRVDYATTDIELDSGAQSWFFTYTPS